MLDRDAQSVLSFYAQAVGTVHQVEPLGNAGGWSGSRLWKVTNEFGGQFCLRRWPGEHPNLQRLRMIHAVLGIVANELPMVAFPLRSEAGTTWIERGSHLWELTDWRPGVADYHVFPRRQRLRKAMQALANFHELAGSYERCHAIAPLAVDRHRQLLKMRQTGTARMEHALSTPLGNALDQRAARLLPLVKIALTRFSGIETLATIPRLPLQPAIRDIHHDHILFSGDQVTGIIDFGAMRIDSPLGDVARLVGSLAADDSESRRFAFDAYSEIRPLDEADRRLIDLFDESGTILGALNWFDWLYCERRDMGPVEPIVRRLDELIGRLETRFAAVSSE